MTDVRGLLIKLLEQYIPEWKSKIGSPVGHKCSWCGMVRAWRVSFDDPEQHDAHCLYRAALEWRIKAENQ